MMNIRPLVAACGGAWGMWHVAWGIGELAGWTASGGG